MAASFDTVSIASVVNPDPATLTWSHTFSGDNRLAVISIGYGAGAEYASGVTINGVACTLVDRRSSVANGRIMEIWQLVAPASGAQDVVASFTSTNIRPVATCLSFAGVDQTTPLGTIQFEEGNGSNPTITDDVSSGSGEIVLDHVIVSYNATRTIAVGASQSEKSNHYDTGYSDANSSRQATSIEDGAATTTMSWTGSGGFIYYAQQSINVKAAAGGGSAFTLEAAAGSFSLAGTAAGLKVARKVSAGVGTFSLAGTAASLLRGYRVAVDSGAYALAGQDAALVKASRLIAEAGGFSLSGTDAGLIAARKITAGAGTYAFSGQDVTLIYTPAGAYILTADGGVFTLAGQAAGLLYGRNLIGETGAFALSGTDASLLRGLSMPAASGSFALSGTATALLYGRLLAADPGAFALTGDDVALLCGRTLSADAGTFALTGNDAALIYMPMGTYILIADAGAFLFDGKPVGLTYSWYRGDASINYQFAKQRRKF